MLFYATVTFLLVTGKKNDHRVKIRTGDIVFPVIRMILASVAQHLCTRCHTLFEGFWETRERSFVNTQHAETVKSKRDGNPSHVCVATCIHRLYSSYRIKH